MKKIITFWIVLVLCGVALAADYNSTYTGAQIDAAVGKVIIMDGLTGPIVGDGSGGYTAWDFDYGDLINAPTIPTVDDTAYNEGTWDANTDAPTKNAVRDKIESLAGGHDAVTLDANVQNMLSLTTQEIGFQTQTANRIFAGPTTGAAAIPTFRALVAADIPDLSDIYEPADSAIPRTDEEETITGPWAFGPLTLASGTTIPNAPGQIRYVNNALSFTGGAVGWYDEDDEVRYFIDTAMVDDTAGGTDALTNRPPSSNAFYDHTAATEAHGATGAVVGTTNSQTLTNKDVSSDTNTFPAVPPDVTMPLIACYNPQNVYDNDSTNHVLVLDPYTPAAQTITAIRIQCDVDPTTEPTLTFKFATAGVGYGSATTIEAIQTANGVANVTSGIDDATIPAGSKIFVTLDDPDNAILVQSIRVELDKD